MNNFNHTRENALGVVPSPWLLRLSLLCSAYPSQEIRRQVGLDSLLACMQRWLRPAQGQYVPTKPLRMWICVSGGEGPPGQPRRSKVYDIGHCPSLCLHCRAPQSSRYFQFHLTNCWCGWYFSHQSFLLPSHLIHITDSRYLSFSVSIYLV